MGIDHPGCYSEPILNDVTIIQYEFIFMVWIATTSSYSNLRIFFPYSGEFCSVPEGLEGGEERLKR